MYLFINSAVFIRILVQNPSSIVEPPSPEAFGNKIVENSSSSTCLVDTGLNWARLVHKDTPFPETCVVAKISPIGENLTAVATIGKITPSIQPPVGKSQVRKVESNATETIHLPSGEKSIPEILLV